MAAAQARKSTMFLLGVFDFDTNNVAAAQAHRTTTVSPGTVGLRIILVISSCGCTQWINILQMSALNGEANIAAVQLTGLCCSTSRDERA